MGEWRIGKSSHMLQANLDAGTAYFQRSHNTPARVVSPLLLLTKNAGRYRPAFPFLLTLLLSYYTYFNNCALAVLFYTHKINTGR